MIMVSRKFWYTSAPPPQKKSIHLRIKTVATIENQHDNVKNRRFMVVISTLSNQNSFVLLTNYRYAQTTGVSQRKFVKTKKQKSWWIFPLRFIRRFMFFEPKFDSAYLTWNFGKSKYDVRRLEWLLYFTPRLVLTYFMIELGHVVVKIQKKNILLPFGKYLGRKIIIFQRGHIRPGRLDLLFFVVFFLFSHIPCRW